MKTAILAPEVAAGSLALIESEIGQRLVFEDMSWEYYQGTVRELEARRRQLRVAQVQGRMELSRSVFFFFLNLAPK